MKNFKFNLVHLHLTSSTILQTQAQGVTNIPQSADPASSKAYMLEQEMLEYSNLQLGQTLHVYDVPILYDGSNYIHTYRCGDHNTENLVLIHGYAGSAVLCYEMLKDLSLKYRVFCIDLLGAGLSSRPEFKCKTTEETVEYFLESFEKWRQAVNIDKFYLGAHSMGGYIAINYAMKYPEKVKKLFLFSPAGLTKYETETDFEDFKTRLGFFKRIAFRTAKLSWDSFMTLSDFYKKFPFFGKYIIKGFVSTNFGKKGREKKFISLLQDYYIELFGMAAGSDPAIFYILGPMGTYGIKPMEDIMKSDLQTQVQCYFGDRDWMERGGALRVAEVKGEAFTVDIVKDAGHNMTMDNPKDLVDAILNGFME